MQAMPSQKEHLAGCSACGNSLVLNGGTCGGSAYAGYTEAGSGSVVAGNNETELRKGVSGDNPVFADTSVTGGCYARAAGRCGTSSGNSLSLYGVKGITAGSVVGFQKLNFTCDALCSGVEIVTLKGRADSPKTDISGAGIKVDGIIVLTGADGGDFKAVDMVILLQNASVLVADCLMETATTHPYSRHIPGIRQGSAD